MKMNIGIIGGLSSWLKDAIGSGEVNNARIAVMMGIHNLYRPEKAPAPYYVFNFHTHRDPDERNRARREILRLHEVDVIFLGDYPLEKLGPEFMEIYSGRILECRTDRLLMGEGGESLPYEMMEGEKVIGLKMAIVCIGLDGEQVLFERSMPYIWPGSSRLFAEASYYGSLHFKEALIAIANGEIALPAGSPWLTRPQSSAPVA